MNKKVLVFHPVIAPYRIDFFNGLYDILGARIILYYRDVKEQGFDHDSIEQKLHFKPSFFKHHIKIGKREFYLGHIKYMLSYRPDIIISGEFGLGLWCAIIYKKLIKKNCRVYTICDDSLDIANRCNGSRRVSRDCAIKHLDGLIMCNNKAAEYYVKQGSSTYVFPIIQKKESFYEYEGETIRIAKEYIESYDLYGKRLFLFVGRLSPEKNIEYLIKSFVKSHDRYPENRLFIIGGCNKGTTGYDAKLKELVDKMEATEYISFLGRKEGATLRAWQCLGQCLVLPSKYEAFGAVVGEALLAGEYVMVSDKAGAVEIVCDNDTVDYNGEIIDISNDFIDFGRISERIVPISGTWSPSESKLRVDFDKLMDGFTEWVCRP